MSGPQNPTPPYTRPGGPNQQTQNSQYHQVSVKQIFMYKVYKINISNEEWFRIGHCFSLWAG